MWLIYIYMKPTFTSPYCEISIIFTGPTYLLPVIA